MSYRPNHRPFFPSWTQNLASMWRETRADSRDSLVKAWCHTCGSTKELSERDLALLIEKVGPDFTLMNRRSRCRTRGCLGWVQFYFLHGVFLPLRDNETEVRWQDDHDALRRAMDLIEREARKRKMDVAQLFVSANVKRG